MTALTAHQVRYKIYSAFHPNAQVNPVNNPVENVNPDTNAHHNIEVEYESITQNKVLRHKDTTGSTGIVLESEHFEVNQVKPNIDMRTLSNAEIDGIYAEVNQLVTLRGGGFSSRIYGLETNQYGFITNPFKSAIAH